MNTKYKFTEEKLKEAASKSVTVVQVMRELGIKNENGGMHSHISRQLKKFNVDISHFTGKGSTKGRVSNAKLTSDSILVKGRNGARRERTERLRRAMLEAGVHNWCSQCGLDPEWCDKPLVLHIDHINGDPLDSRKTNLRFLCPNCHSQTDTFGNKAR